MSAWIASSHEPTTVPRAEVERATVEATHLSKLFEMRPVLRDVTFVLPGGKTLALLGPNGAGKTTLLRVLATLTKPSRGQASVAGYDVQGDADEVRRVIGYVGHQPHVYDDLTARENLMFFARMYGLPDAAERALRLLERVGLRTRANERARTLSRGQLQRLALARGILNDPPVLLLDEPDTGLDENASTLLRELIEERLASGRTTIFTTHQLDRGLAMSDDALVLVGGRLGYLGKACDISLAEVRALYTRDGRWTR